SPANVERIRAGGSAIGPMRRLDIDALSAEVADFDLIPSLRHPKNLKFMTRPVQCAVKAALEAVAQSRLQPGQIAPDRLACYTRSGQTGLEHEEFFPALNFAWSRADTKDLAHLTGRAAKLVDPYFSLRTLSNIGIALIATELNIRGPSANYVHNDTA